jgi:hypothetical protein
MVKRILPTSVRAIRQLGRNSTDILGLEVVTDMGWVVTFASPENPTAQLTIVDAVRRFPIRTIPLRWQT